MPHPRSSVDRPPPDRLALGPASRLLGVDPDTLRRWADEGQVPAFTTPGGHRRFERLALEQLIDARRTGPASAGLGPSPDRLGAAYRRRYRDRHGRGPLGTRTAFAEAERETYRELGRRLVDALIRHLDETGARRHDAPGTAEREAIDLAAGLGRRLGIRGVPLADGVAMFVAARRPFLAELAVAARRRGADPLRVAAAYDAATGLLDRLLLAFVAAHEAAAPKNAPATSAIARRGD